MKDNVIVHLRTGESIKGITANWQTAGDLGSTHLILVV